MGASYSGANTQKKMMMEGFEASEQKVVLKFGLKFEKVYP